MNRDLQTMITLQEYWDRVIEGKQGIERSKKAIEYWNSRVEEKGRSIRALEEEIKIEKAAIKELEVDLALKDRQREKLEARKLSVKTEKELSATENELALIRKSAGDVEESLIVRFDSLSEMESRLETWKDEHRQAKEQSEKDIVQLGEEISRYEKTASENEALFGGILPNLASEYASKFKKLISGKDGRAIVPLDGNNCGGCHFEIPVHIVIEASKNEAIHSCTNCGKFIFRKTS